MLNKFGKKINKFGWKINKIGRIINIIISRVVFRKKKFSKKTEKKRFAPNINFEKLTFFFEIKWKTETNLKGFSYFRNIYLKSNQKIIFAITANPCPHLQCIKCQKFDIFTMHKTRALHALEKIIQLDIWCRVKSQKFEFWPCIKC